MNTQLTAKAAVKDTLPTMLGYIGIGIAFGVVGKAAGFSTLIIFLMSFIIYAGSAQFITVSLLAISTPILSIVLATFLVNARMILMSMTVAPFFKQESLLKNILIGTFLTDESFALGMNKQIATDHQLSFAWFNTANILSYGTWVGSTLVGALIGAFIPNPESLGLDFAIIAMFIGLLYLQVATNRQLSLALQLSLIGLTFLGIYFGMIIIPHSLLVLVITLIVCGIGVVIKHAFN